MCDEDLSQQESYCQSRLKSPGDRQLMYPSKCNQSYNFSSQ
ncbi:hypothetical protein [Oscillatoria salina]